jgi:hypothetical protein
VLGNGSVAVAIALSAVPACRSKDKGPSAKPSASGDTGVVPGFPVPPPVGALAWKPLADPGVVGLPAGCTVNGPIRRAPLPSLRVRFFAPLGSASELVLATDEDGEGSVDRDVVLTAEGRPGRALPWKRMDAPPLLARTSRGYRSLAVESIGGGLERAVLWHEPGRLEAVAEGEKLEAVDLACAAGTCALLLTSATKTAGPGATVFVGSADAPVSTWARTDLPGEEQGFVPFSVVAIRGKGAVVSLTAGPLFKVWRIESGKAEPLATITSPFGAYDIALGDEPFAVSPSRKLDEPCTVDGFSVRLITGSGSASEVDGQVPPAQVITRRVLGGFMVAWLAPVSCRHDGQSIVRAFLVDEKGVPSSSTMAVADADGFALSTNGDDGNVDVWLSRRGELVWVRATCRATTLGGPSGDSGRP